MYKTLNVDNETFKSIDRLSRIFDVSKLKLIKGFVNFFYDNQKFINADFFEKSDFTKMKEIDEKLKDMIEKIVQKISSKETNRIIGFIRTQDKFMEGMKRDFLFKINPDHNPEYHPMFDHYDLVLKYIELFLEAQNQSIDKDIVPAVEKNSEQMESDQFKRSLMNIRFKILEY